MVLKRIRENSIQSVITSAAVSRYRLVFLSLGCLLAGWLALSVDAAVALTLAPPEAFHQPTVRSLAAEYSVSALPGDLRRVVELSEVFGHGIGVVVSVLLISVLHPAGRRKLPSIVGTTLLAGLTATCLKTLISRVRPMDFDFHGSILTTFRAFDVAQPIRHAFLSTPSAHAATAVALAVSLTRVYPRGRWLFAGFAVLACLQRITGGAHFLSDVCWGAAIGFAASVVTLRWPQPARIPHEDNDSVQRQHRDVSSRAA